MTVSSVLLSADAQESAAPKYSLLLSTDPVHIEAAQKLRYEVFRFGSRGSPFPHQTT